MKEKNCFEKPLYKYEKLSAKETDLIFIKEINDSGYNIFRLLNSPSIFPTKIIRISALFPPFASPLGFYFFPIQRILTPLSK